MKKMLLLCGSLMLVASIASADALNIAWTACYGDGGTLIKTSACTSTIGTQVLALSYTSDIDIAAYQGIGAYVNVGTDGPLPSWWGNGCTGKLPTAMFGVNAGNTLCANDAYGGVTGGGGVGAVNNLWNGANTTQVHFALANAAGAEVPLTAGLEYFMANVTLSNAKSTVASNCPGCLTPACILFARADIDRLGFSVPATVTQGGAQPLVYWQASTTGAGCAGATPTRKSTWGSVKALYR